MIATMENIMSELEKALQIVLEDTAQQITVFSMLRTAEPRVGMSEVEHGELAESARQRAITAYAYIQARLYQLELSLDSNKK